MAGMARVSSEFLLQKLMSEICSKWQRSISSSEYVSYWCDVGVLSTHDMFVCVFCFADVRTTYIQAIRYCCTVVLYCRTYVVH